MFRAVTILFVLILMISGPRISMAMVSNFFESSQVASLLNAGVTSDTISSQGYLFTYTRDKLFTGGTGSIIGRSVRIPWPTGVESQAVTTPPAGVTDYKARLLLERVDQNPFDLQAFTAKLLANTAGTGASFEIMPILDGEDAFDDPLYFDASGYYGNSFSYDTTPNPWGSTSLLTGFEAYKISLFVDFALTSLALDGPNICDFNVDSHCDIDDLNSMLAIGPIASGISATGERRRFDLTGDGHIDNQDTDQWLSVSAQFNGLDSSYRRGDANLDGLVDGVDFGLWNIHKLSTTLLWNEGNFDGNATNDSADLTFWMDNRFSAVAAATAGIPEPALGAPFAACCFVVLALRARRH